jgi:hypothetical protein
MYLLGKGYKLLQVESSAVKVFSNSFESTTVAVEPVPSSTAFFMHDVTKL